MPCHAQHSAAQEQVLLAMNEARTMLEAAVANASKLRSAPPRSSTSYSDTVSSSPTPKKAAMMSPAQTPTDKDIRLFILGLMMHIERSTDYLSKTLEALAASELSRTERITGSRVRVLVFDASPTGSSQVAAARRRFARTPLFNFASAKMHSAKVMPPIKSSAAKQSRDVAEAISVALELYDFRYLLLLEDDWLACRGLLSAIVLALEATERHFSEENVLAIRVSYGLNGVLIPREPLPDFANFIVQAAPKLPPDHALARWAHANGKLVTFRHNVFVHIGARSSIGNSNGRWNTACYELLYDWLQLDTEAFMIDKCAHDVVSPCRPTVPNPKPERKHKSFSCDVALQDFPAYLASTRLGSCVSDAHKTSKLPAKLFAHQ